MSLTKGDVIEIGSGIYSTPYLHWACHLEGRKLISIENNDEYAAYARKFEAHHHQIEKEIPADREWDIAFVDSFPHEDRREIAKALADKAKYVVVHDYDGREDWRADFKYFYHYCGAHPETAIFSNVVDLSDLKI